MKKFFAVVIVLLFSCTTFASVHMDELQDFALAWLHTYDIEDNSPWLHFNIGGGHNNDPTYIPEESYNRTFSIWDLNTDGIVNYLDFVRYRNLDLETVLIKKEQKLRQVLCGPSMDELIIIAELDLIDLDIIKTWMIRLDADRRDIGFMSSIINSKNIWLNRVMNE